MAPKHLVLHALFWLLNRSPAGHRHSYSVQRPHLKDFLPLPSICAPLCLDSETRGIPILAHSLFPFLLISNTYWPLLILTIASASIKHLMHDGHDVRRQHLAGGEDGDAAVTGDILRLESAKHGHRYLVLSI